MSSTPSRTGKFSTTVDPKRVIRFPRDSEGGPSICFVYAPDATLLLVLIEGWRVLLRNALNTQRQPRVVALRYTATEWDAFIQGVRAGEFNAYTSGTIMDLVPMRDSKDPDGPILVFTVAQMQAFFTAVRAGKYDSPALTTKSSRSS